MRSESQFKPVGQLKGRFEELWEDNCLQTGNEDGDVTLDDARVRWGPYFVGIMRETYNNPCAGCPVLNGGKCPAFQKFHTAAASSRVRDNDSASVADTKPPGTKNFRGMSVKQIAEKLRVSKSEVRRMKHRGQL